jgi:hypothetical protein
MPSTLVEYFNFSVQRVPSVELVSGRIPPDFLIVDYLQVLASMQEAMRWNRNAAHARLSSEPVHS